jgi:CRISPR-associated protein Cmr6
MSQHWLLPNGKHFDMTALGRASNASLVCAKFGGRLTWENDKLKFDEGAFRDTFNRALSKKELHGFEVFDCLDHGDDRERYRAALQRRHALVKALCGVTVSAATEGRFVTGTGLNSPLDVGIELHPVYGVPYVPSAGVKVLVREYVRNWSSDGEDEDMVNWMFGVSDDNGSYAGALMFFDALPEADGAESGTLLEFDVMTPHYSPWYQGGNAPGDWHSPNPIKFLTVPGGSRFHFALAMRRGEGTEKDRNLACCWLKEALDWLGAGAKTAAGYGRFSGFRTVSHL